MIFYDKKGYPVDFENYEYLDRGNNAKVYVKEDVAIKVFDCKARYIMKKDLFQRLKYSGIENIVQLYDYYQFFKWNSLFRKVLTMDAYTMEYIKGERTELLFASKGYIDKVLKQLEDVIYRLAALNVVIYDAHEGNIIFNEKGANIIDPDHFYIAKKKSLDEIAELNKRAAIKYINCTLDFEMGNYMDMYDVRYRNVKFIDECNPSLSLTENVKNNIEEEFIYHDYVKKLKKYIY